jgi:hypothetical protein
MQNAGSASSAAGAPSAAGASAIKPVGAGDLPASLSRSVKGIEDADFSQVKIADGSGRPTLNAQAYTKGADVAFKAGDAGAGAPAGKNLIAHEAAHVVQQRAGVKQ